MRNLWLNILFIVVGLTLGNFVYQIIMTGTPQWGVAAERSLFQALAVALVVFFGLMATKTRR